MTSPRVRTVGSIANELLKKSREAAIAAVQIFNSPTITFKSEIFIVQMIISWTYLLHAYYRKHGIEYRHYRQVGLRRRFSHTARGAHKYWELESCLNCEKSPVEKSAAQNLRFLIGLRHEIEHQMTRRLDEHLSARYQACCLNYNELVKKLFGPEFGIEKHLALTLQFSAITMDQADALRDASGLPSHIKAFIDAFDHTLTPEEFNDPRFAYRLFFLPKSANHIGQADKVIEFIKASSPLAENVNREYAHIRDVEKQKYLPSQIIAKMRQQGFSKFSMHDHTMLWKQRDAKKTTSNFGTNVVNTWYWYENWLKEVEAHCTEQGQRFK